MKIDTEKLKRLVAKGVTAEALLDVLLSDIEAHEARRAKRRPIEDASKERTRAKNGGSKVESSGSVVETPQSTNSDFDLFWTAFPNKVGKAAARKAFVAAAKKVRVVEMFEALERYAHKTDDRPFCNPSTWLNQERWLDQPAVNNGRRTVQQATDDLLTKLRAFDEPAPSDIRDGTGENVVRLLPAPGRERS